MAGSTTATPEMARRAGSYAGTAPLRGAHGHEMSATEWRGRQPADASGSARAPACARRSRARRRTTRVAPSPSRCSTAASEWARARISIDGLVCAGLLDHLARLERLGNGDEQPARLLEIGGGEDLGVGGVADEHLGAVAPRLSRLSSLVSITTICAPLRASAAPTSEPDPAVADQHVVARQGGRRQRLGRFRRIGDAALGMRPRPAGRTAAD